MSRSTDELIVETIEGEMDSWVGCSEKADASINYRVGFKAGIYRAKKILREWLLDPDPDLGDDDE